MKTQRGATMVVILVVLLLVTTLGAIAVKSSIFGLGVATNSQIQALLLANTDAALFNVENQSKVTEQLTQDGMFGYFNGAADNDELVFCYRADETEFFSMDYASVIEEDGTYSKNGVDGFCTRKTFATGRSAVLSQVYLYENTEASTALSGLAIGTSAGSSSSVATVSYNIRAMVISVLPSFSDVSATEVRDCFRKTSIKKTTDTETVEECFAELNVPYSIQYSDYLVSASPTLS